MNLVIQADRPFSLRNAFRMQWFIILNSNLSHIILRWLILNDDVHSTPTTVQADSGCLLVNFLLMNIILYPRAIYICEM